MQVPIAILYAGLVFALPCAAGGLWGIRCYRARGRPRYAVLLQPVN